MIPDSSLPRRLVERLSDDTLAIFLFHGVIPRRREGIRNYTNKHIEAPLFVECLRALRAGGAPVSIDDVLAYEEAGQPYPPRAFVVTFDDGFANNYSVAAPVLDDFRVPAAFYVTTGFVETNGMSWIDRIERVVESAPDQTLRVDWSDTAFQLGDEDSRIDFLEAVRTYVKGEPACDADAFADDLCDRLGAPAASSSDECLDAKLTWAQVRQLHEHSLFTVGGHGHTHAILSFLSADRLRGEIAMSLRLLGEKAGVAPFHYSYPEGLDHCVSDAVIGELRRGDVRCCPTAIDGTNRRGDDLFRLKRIPIGGRSR
jgi:peptidoglycan/xylan/chitin deacetylase (PgdA/CDA1 family)